MQFIKYYLTFFCILSFNILLAQNYQAINGSSYAGSLSPANNPASIVHVPYSWDFTPFAVQIKQTTNAVKIEKYSLLSSPKNAEISLQNGEKKRYIFTNQDIRLLNARININAKAAIAFGVTIRNYGYLTTNKANAQDTTQRLRDFFIINKNNTPLSSEGVLSSWAEIYGSYARTIIDENGKLLNAGITLKINKSLAGGYVQANNFNYSTFSGANNGAYTLNSGNLQYGYSSNFDKIDSNNSLRRNLQEFLQHTYSGISADIGLEYILQTSEDKEEGGEYAYNTKVGISIMDIGNNKFKYGRNSSMAVAGNAGITDTLLENKFSTVTSVGGFNDSLLTIVSAFTQLAGNFSIYQPTRLVINVDQHIMHNFFINTQLTLPLLSVFSKKITYLKDINLLAITPRWEIKALGAYLPILFNNRNQLWVGAAFKAGPFLVGTHNLANIFSKNKMQAGGFYLAFTIRPGKIYERAAHYPEKSSNKKTKNLDCPKL